jgi:PAS domain S-box-containing protein
LLAAGDPLAETQRQAEHGLEFAKKARFGLIIDIIKVQIGLIRTLRGLTPKFGSFDDGEFDELWFEGYFANRTAPAVSECGYWIRKLQARFLAGDYASAIYASSRAQRVLWTSTAVFEAAEYEFYGALAKAASCDSAAGAQRQQHFDALATHHRQLRLFAENCPENFENRAALVSAEIARLEGRELDAERLYEQAIRSAQANDFVHNEALANELAARFYAARGFEKIANAYLRDARYSYLCWGADGKVRQLDQLYPHLRAEEPLSGPAGTIAAPVEHLDLATVLKVSQAVSGEIVFEKLIDTLMRTAIEHAGAERGVLILPPDSEQRIEAEATTSGDTIVVRLKEASVTVAGLPESIVHYVVRTQETVILDDASAENSFSADPYIRRQHARSILCIPLINQAKLIGLLYLENSLTPHVFTPTRLTALKLLASQAAISLENARLYADLRQENCDRSKAEEALRASEERMNLAAEAANLGMWVWDVVRDEVWMTDKGRALFGFAPDERLDSAALITRLHPEDRAARAAAVGRALETQGEYAMEYRVVLPDGQMRWIAGRGRVEFGDGKPLRMRGVSLDITERRQAELEAARQRTELAHASRLTIVGELTASIAHEINQPLGAILSNAETAGILLQSKQPHLEEVQQILADIRKDDLRASEVIRHMRELLRKRELELKLIDLNAVTSDVLRLVDGETRRRGVKIQKQFADTLPVVRGDVIHLQQVLLNLILNGMEAMSESSESNRRLTMRTAHDGKGNVEVAVEDSGPGVPSDRLPRLFDSFFTTKTHGMGLGLSIVRSIVEAHGGRIWAENNSSGGACFRFTLPVNGKE